MPEKKKLLTADLIRKIDFWCGIPLAALLTGWRRITQKLGFRKLQQTPRKILFLKMTEQGATVLAWPAIRRAIDMVGAENVYFWVFQENKAILLLLNMIKEENIVAVRADRPLEFALDMLRSLWRIRRAGIDCSVDLEFFSRASAIFAYLCGASSRVGLERFTNEGPYRGDLLTHKVAYNFYLHTSEMYRVLVESLNADLQESPLLKEVAQGIEYSEGRMIALPPADPLIRFESTLEQREAVWKLLQAESSVELSKPIILLNPNASDLLPLRKWPQERFEQLARGILERWPQATVVFTGSKAEASVPEEMVRSIGSPRAVSLAGKTDMERLLCLYQLSDVLVTNDSGPGHFASTTDIHAIVLFGPETPLLFGPRGARADVLWAGLACSPCVSVYNHRLSPCNNNLCMQRIRVEQVLERIERCLEKSL
ncbi:MAG: glycosyltransferase family 9 protein [Candidatus Eremiobacteraeota bacterium]|nr:glycosyltransferase family 9 protein [Candidatus Eremiobacteraeota bacterium]